MKVFLSHSSKDNVLAGKIFRWLRYQPISIWIDDLELRPSDPLIQKITKGIDEAQFLLVLVTPSSNKSHWVNREIKLALKREVPPKFNVIPILLEGCRMPHLLKNRVYVRVKKDDTEFPGIISGIFRDCYIMELVLSSNNFELDREILMHHLNKYIQSPHKKIRVFLKVQDFNNQVYETMKRSPTVKANTRKESVEKLMNNIKKTSPWIQQSLQLYWLNLSELLSQLTNNIFDAGKKNYTSLYFAYNSIDNTMMYCQYGLSCFIRTFPLFVYYARKLELDAIANFVSKFEKYNHGSPDHDKQVLSDIFECAIDNLASVDLIEKDHTNYISSLYVPNIDGLLPQQLTLPIHEVIQGYAWYNYCIPQIILQSVIQSVGAEMKPIHELGYKIGLRIDDYDKIGWH